jgi:hypothetical protein
LILTAHKWLTRSVHGAAKLQEAGEQVEGEERESAHCGFKEDNDERKKWKVD